MHNITDYPGAENPVHNPSVPTSENTDGITLHDTMGYQSPLFDVDPSDKFETLDQHDIIDHPGVPTISGVDHVNPRGSVVQDSELDVPENSAGIVPLEVSIARIFAREISKIIVRNERPTHVINRTLATPVNNDPQCIAPRDENRARMVIYPNTNNTYIGAFDEVASGGGFLLTATMPPVVIEHQDELWAKGTNAASGISFFIELWAPK